MGSFPWNALTHLNRMGSGGPSQPHQVLTAASGTAQLLTHLQPRLVR